MNKFHLWLRLFLWTIFGFGNIALGIFLIKYEHFINLRVFGWIWTLSSIGWFYKAWKEYHLLIAKITVDRIFKKSPPK